MNNVVIRSFIKDGVEVTLCDGVFFIVVNGVIKIEAKLNKDKTWSIFSATSRVNFNNFEEVWGFIQDLAQHYCLFPPDWNEENYETLCCVFKGVMK